MTDGGPGSAVGVLRDRLHVSALIRLRAETWEGLVRMAGGDSEGVPALLEAFLAGEGAAAPDPATHGVRVEAQCPECGEVFRVETAFYEAWSLCRTDAGAADRGGVDEEARIRRYWAELDQTRVGTETNTLRINTLESLLDKVGGPDPALGVVDRLAADLADLRARVDAESSRLTTCYAGQGNIGAGLREVKDRLARIEAALGIGADGRSAVIGALLAVAAERAPHAEPTPSNAPLRPRIVYAPKDGAKGEPREG